MVGISLWRPSVFRVPQLNAPTPGCRHLCCEALRTTGNVVVCRKARELRLFCTPRRPPAGSSSLLGSLAKVAGVPPDLLLGAGLLVVGPVAPLALAGLDGEAGLAAVDLVGLPDAAQVQGAAIFVADLVRPL
jgi:hypothetical protein